MSPEEVVRKYRIFLLGRISIVNDAGNENAEEVAAFIYCHPSNNPLMCLSKSESIC